MKLSPGLKFAQLESHPSIYPYEHNKGRLFAQYQLCISILLWPTLDFVRYSATLQAYAVVKASDVMVGID